MKIGTRVALKGDDFQDPGVIVGIRRKSPATSPNGKTMSDDLRTRIAAAIYEDTGFGWSRYMCEEAADAVIRELHPEYRCELCGRIGTQKFREMGTGWVCRSVSACDRRANR